MKKNILALQISSVIADAVQNFKNLDSYLSRILRDKYVDFLFLPEVWSVGWYTKCFKDNADDGEIIEFLSNVAKKYDINIFGGSYIRKTQSGLKNSCPVITRDGSILGFYDKIHLYAPDGEADAVCPGDTPVVFEIEGLRTGVSICYDIRFPELFRSYINSDNPPHLLVNMSAWPMTRAGQYSKMAASRAIENQSYFLALSQCGEIKDGVYNSGSSCVYDPMGNCIEKLDEKSGYIYFSLDTKIVNDIRCSYPNLNNRLVYDFGFTVKEISSQVSKC